MKSNLTPFSIPFLPLPELTPEELERVSGGDRGFMPGLRAREEAAELEVDSEGRAGRNDPP
jgi:hypothetical protein